MGCQHENSLRHHDVGSPGTCAYRFERSTRPWYDAKASNRDYTGEQTAKIPTDGKKYELDRTTPVGPVMEI